MTFQVFIATHAKHLASQIERKAKYGGLSTVAVLPTADAVLARVGESEPCLVVIDAVQNEANALAIVKVLAESRQGAKAVILGRSPDLSLVARAIVAGASHFLLESTPADEFGKALADLVAGKQPNEESLFGRVFGSLPASESREGWFRTRSGRRLSTEDAIKQCDQFGFSVDEITDYLKVPSRDAERITKKARKIVKPSLMSRIASSVIPVDGSRRQLTLVLACLATISLLPVLMGHRNRGPMPYELAPVSGTVSLDGSTLTRGLVRLVPDVSLGTKGPTGIGVINANGQFRVATAGYDGAVVGHHRVTVIPLDVVQADPTKFVLQPIPDHFTNPTTSGLMCEVTSKADNTLPLNLLTPISPTTSPTAPRKLRGKK